MALLSGKRILVTGLLSNRSIAYGIAKVARREGAEIALTYQNERFRDRAEDMAKELGASAALPCEVTSDAEIAELFKALGAKWDGLDGLVHALAKRRHGPRLAEDARMTTAPSRQRGERLAPHVFELPVEKMREGYYTDAYFNHTRSALLASKRWMKTIVQLFPLQTPTLSRRKNGSLRYSA